MKTYRAADGERLDTIVYKIYRSIETKIMVEVMDANEHLLGNVKLSAGDIVYLPDVQITQQDSTLKALWL